MRVKIKKTPEKKPIDVDLEEIDNEINNIIRKIFKFYPYIALPYMYLGRAYRPVGTAAVSANGWLIINPYWWNKITPIEKFFVVIHEILHAMLQHQVRMPPSYTREYNIIADAIVNAFAVNTLSDIVVGMQNSSVGSNPDLIREKIESLSMRSLVNWETIRELFRENGLEPPEDLERMSADDIFTRLYHGIIKNLKRRQALYNSPGMGVDFQGNENSSNGNGSFRGGKNSGKTQNGDNSSASGGGSSTGNDDEKSTNNRSSGGAFKKYGGRAGSRSHRGAGGGQQDQPQKGTQDNNGSSQGGENSGDDEKNTDNHSRGGAFKKYGGRTAIRNDRGTGGGQQGQPQNDTPDNNGSGQCKNPDTSTEDYENGPLGGDLIADYDPSEDDAEVTKMPHPMFDKVKDSKSAENAWKRIHREAANFQKLVNTRRKTAGAGTFSIEELISIVDNDSKISWQKIIKEAVREHYRGFTDRSFKREDRRYSAMKSLHERRDNIYLPGVVRYNIPDIHVTFDTSGSMSEEELQQILTEVYTIAKKFRTKIRVTQWDWDIQDDRIVTNPENFKVFTVRGRGGTSIIPVLQYILGKRDFNGKKYKLEKEAMIIVFSDFELFDDDEEVYKYLREIEKTKKVRFIFVNTKTFEVFDSKRFGLKKAFELALQSE